MKKEGKTEKGNIEMKKKSFPLIFKELPNTKIKKKNSVKL